MDKRLKESGVSFGAEQVQSLLPSVLTEPRCQRCWVHKTANVLNKLPKKTQVPAKKALQQIWMAETRKDAERAFDRFAEVYRAKYPKTVEYLEKDHEVLLTFYDFTGRALDPPADDEPHRVDVCYGQAADGQDEGRRIESGLPHHGVEVGPGSREEVEIGPISRSLSPYQVEFWMAGRLKNRGRLSMNHSTDPGR